ncbi:hypothetical protein VTL71DRAFT_8780 [Oculimacula yallundae]|uniref:Uncharacterized protein n=1 Tax=Oculimacula yallundae TaxID=86028 RepID=A0ABR4CYT4_9HELO
MRAQRTERMFCGFGVVRLAVHQRSKSVTDDMGLECCNAREHRAGLQNASKQASRQANNPGEEVRWNGMSESGGGTLCYAVLRYRQWTRQRVVFITVVEGRLSRFDCCDARQGNATQRKAVYYIVSSQWWLSREGGGAEPVAGCCTVSTRDWTVRS